MRGRVNARAQCCFGILHFHFRNCCCYCYNSNGRRAAYQTGRQRSSATSSLYGHKKNRENAALSIKVNTCFYTYYIHNMWHTQTTLKHMYSMVCSESCCCAFKLQYVWQKTFRGNGRVAGCVRNKPRCIFGEPTSRSQCSR